MGYRAAEGTDRLVFVQEAGVAPTLAPLHQVRRAGAKSRKNPKEDASGRKGFLGCQSLHSENDGRHRQQAKG